MPNEVQQLETLLADSIDMVDVLTTAAKLVFSSDAQVNAAAVSVTRKAAEDAAKMCIDVGITLEAAEITKLEGIRERLLVELITGMTQTEIRQADSWRDWLYGLRRTYTWGRDMMPVS